jgi:hypothetical protein
VRRRLLAAHAAQAPTGPVALPGAEQPILPLAVSSPDTALLAVEFHVQCMPLPFGDRLCIVGDLPQLGAWEPNKGLVLEWRAGHDWAASAQLQPGGVQFKVSRL